jgi:hypothetical protein
MGQEVEPECEQGIDPGDGNNPFPIEGWNENGKKKEADNEDQSREDKVTHLLPRRNSVDTFCSDLNAPVESLFTSFL